MDLILSATRLGIALAFMLAACVTDWRTRKVPNRIWILLGIAGMALLAVQMLLSETDNFLGAERTYGPIHFLVFVPIAVIFMDTFWDREPIYENGKLNPLPLLPYTVALVCTLVLLLAEGPTPEVGQLLSVPAVMCVFIMFYYLGIVRGGADAKALLALSIVFPFYPVFESLPLIGYPEGTADMLQMTFPFAFLILMNAAVLHAVSGPAVRFFRNLARGDRGFPEMFLGYRMDIGDVPKSFVWPMEAVRDGEIVLILFPSRSGDVGRELAMLREKGASRIWVTPKDPFIIPMTAGIIFSVVVGNMVALLF